MDSFVTFDVVFLTHLVAVFDAEYKSALCVGEFGAPGGWTAAH